MRITIDTGLHPGDKHHIKVEGEYTMDELIKFLSRYYPDFTWKDVVICQELPAVARGLWSQIKDTSRQPYNPTPIQPWGSVPYIGDVITGTGSTSAGATYTAGTRNTKLSTDLFDTQDTLSKPKM
jgi:hypothetical protein